MRDPDLIDHTLDQLEDLAADTCQELDNLRAKYAQLQCEFATLEGRFASLNRKITEWLAQEVKRGRSDRQGG